MALADLLVNCTRVCVGLNQQTLLCFSYSYLLSILFLSLLSNFSVFISSSAFVICFYLCSSHVRNKAFVHSFISNGCIASVALDGVELLTGVSGQTRQGEKRQHWPPDRRALIADTHRLGPFCSRRLLRCSPLERQNHKGWINVTCSIRGQQILQSFRSSVAFWCMHVVKKNLLVPSSSSLGRFHLLNWIWTQRFSLTLQDEHKTKVKFPWSWGHFLKKGHENEVAFGLLFLTDFRRTAWSSAITLSMLAAAASFWRGFLWVILFRTILCVRNRQRGIIQLNRRMLSVVLFTLHAAKWNHSKAKQVHKICSKTGKNR